MNLKGNETKTKITNIIEDRAVFLNVNIFRSHQTKFSYNLSLIRKLRLTAPVDKIRARLEQAGFMVLGKAYPNFKLMAYSHDKIIHIYNSVFRDYKNYYSIAHNQSKLVSTLHFTLYTSCAKLLAAKFKLGTTAKVYKKFGPSLRGPKSSFVKAIYTTNYRDFKVNTNPI